MGLNMKLKVLAGAKEGTLVPLKRSKFLIGRASECTLRAGSDAISRRHCVILTTDEGVAVRDLGSRNGTLVNGVKISKETPLRDGDRVRIGPLEFEVVAEASAAKGEKKPKVKSVAEAVDRAASQSHGDVAEDDISNWLLAPNENDSPSTSSRETTSFRMDETSTTRMGGLHRHSMPVAEPEDSATPLPVDEEAETEEGADGEGEGTEPAEGKDKKKQQKKTFGKLPDIPKKPGAKDSREAAADVLREMARRR